ncbi:hypothetical protein BDY24DRAFT_387172 [Mrakia frigida]|uniref:RNA exonuclease n=1 Tax=Mrakia frigida TaxID=29902 RepID=UPI003FCC1F88
MSLRPLLHKIIMSTSQSIASSSSTSTDLAGSLKRKASSTNVAEGSAPSTSSAVAVVEGGAEVAISREERRKDKKRRKEESKAAAQAPTFQFNTGGFSQGRKVGVAHLRDLILHLLCGHKSPEWLVTNHRPHITSVTVLFVQGITPPLLGMATPPISQNLPFPLPLFPAAASLTSSTDLPIIGQLFSHACPVKCPGDRMKLHSALSMFMSAPLSPKEKLKREVERREMLRNTTISTTSATRYLLTLQQMLDNDYPIPASLRETAAAEDEGEVISRAATSGNGPVTLAYKDAFVQKDPLPKGEKGEIGWVETAKGGGPEEGEMNVLAVDCEMCMTAEGPFLARISVIDVASGKKVYDEVVKPPGVVTDYLTKWSGITPEALSKAVLTLAEVQTFLLANLITPRTILLGHSLESDLKALKLRHPWCIDTAVLFKHPKGPPYKPGLKYLAKTLLEKEIQTGEGGHDPEEDARTCLELLEMKLKLGPEFGTSEETESIFRRISRQPRAAPKNGTLTTAMFDKGVSNFRATTHELTTCGDCKNDEEVVDALVENAGKHDFTFGRLTSLSENLGWHSAKNTPASDPSLPSSSSPPSTSSVLTTLNANLARIHASLPARSALIIFTGHADPRPMLALQEKKKVFDAAFKKGPAAGGPLPEGVRWMEDDERKLEAEVAVAREGLGFFCVKV